MATQGDMKVRIAQELRRDDLGTEIANAISTAILFYQFDRFNSWNQTSIQSAPASDGETGNPWMNAGEPLIRNRAKALLYAGTIKQFDIAKGFFDLAGEFEAKLKTSTLYQSLSSFTIGTLGYMKARIANELERGDLTIEIANAVAQAISYYQPERLYFNETRETTFNTVTNQYLYTSADKAELGQIINIDYIFAYIGNQPYRLHPFHPEIMEWSHLDTNDPVGQPIRYSWYGSKLGIYPTPDQAYKLRLGAQLQAAAPAADGTTGNIWMTDCEDLIRARAKYELYTHIPAIKDLEQAAVMKALAEDAFDQLRERTSDLESVGDYIIEPWGY